MSLKSLSDPTVTSSRTRQSTLQRPPNFMKACPSVRLLMAMLLTFMDPLLIRHCFVCYGVSLLT